MGLFSPLLQRGLRRAAWMLLPLAGLALLPQCSAPLLPQPQPPALSRRMVDDAELLARLQRDWLLLQRDLPVEEMRRVAADYNEALLLLLRRVRLDAFYARKKGCPMAPLLFEVQHEDWKHKLSLREVYEDMLPACDVKVKELKEHYTVSGLGVPLVGVIPRRTMDKLAPEDLRARFGGTVSTLTAVMDFSRPGKPVLRLIRRQRVDSVRVGRLQYQLAADFSAPIELYWGLTQIKDDRFLGLLRPQSLRDVSGLTCVEPYNPNKIPVIMTHGLMSSAGTFDNLVNRLTNDPLIREKFQFWYYNYPTGISWVVSAREYRCALAQARRLLDPHGRNKNWDKMVVLGHSMGGLITHYSQCEEPWLMMRATEMGRKAMPEHPRYYVDHPAPVPAYEAMRQDYFFRPVKAGLVLYLATPHQGAPLATYRLVASLTQLVRLPQNLLDELLNVATLQQDSLLLNPKDMPRKLTQWFTSVNQLAPESYSISGLRGLRVRPVPTHSVIGDRGRGNSPKSSDGVVPYWSSHISWGSETIVPSDHSVQDVPETAEDLRRVLRDYLQKNPPQSHGLH